MDKTLKASFFALLAALLYSFSSPFSKVLLSSFPPTLLAGVLYLGAGIGTSTLFFTNKNKERERIDKSDMVYVILMVILDIAAPVFMMKGLSITRSENASLLGNFEIVATAIIALLFFRKRISKKSGLAILLITLSSFILSYNRSTSFFYRQRFASNNSRNLFLGLGEQLHQETKQQRPNGNSSY